MDIVSNDNGLLFNLFAFLASWFLLSVALLATWIFLVEINIFLNNRRVAKEYAKITTAVEELYNDFE